MHNHNGNNQDGMSAMVWMMVICCGLPLLLVLFGGTLTGTIRWIFLGLAAAFMVWHFRKMRQGSCHGESRAPSDQGTAVAAEAGDDHRNH